MRLFQFLALRLVGHVLRLYFNVSMMFLILCLLVWHMLGNYLLLAFGEEGKFVMLAQAKLGVSIHSEKAFQMGPDGCLWHHQDDVLH